VVKLCKLPCVNDKLPLFTLVLTLVLGVYLLMDYACNIIAEGKNLNAKPLYATFVGQHVVRQKIVVAERGESSCNSELRELAMRA